MNRSNTSNDARIQIRHVAAAIVVPCVLHSTATSTSTGQSQEQLDLLRRSLVDVAREVRTGQFLAPAPGGSIAHATAAIDAAVRDIDSLVATTPGAAALPEPVIEAIGSTPVQCTDPGEAAQIYISLSAAAASPMGSAFGILVHGTQGFEQFSFVTAITIPNIVAAINEFTGETGVTASPGPGSSSNHRVRLQSELVGDDQFVAAFIMSGPPILFASFSGTGSEHVWDFGEDPIYPWAAATE